MSNILIATWKDVLEFRVRMPESDSNVFAMAANCLVVLTFLFSSLLTYKKLLSFSIYNL